MLIILAILSTVALACSITIKVRWIQVVTGGLIFIFTAYVLIFFSGSIARSVLAPGPPAKSTIDNFYLGIQLLQNELFDCYLLVTYLSFLGFINAVWGNKKSK
jgi:hypothetical protein